MPQAALKIRCNRPHLPPRSLHPSPKSGDCENDDGDDGDDGGGGGGDVNVNDDVSAARDGDLSNCNPFHLVVHYRIYKHCHAVLRQDLKTKMERYLSPPS